MYSFSSNSDLNKYYENSIDEIKKLEYSVEKKTTHQNKMELIGFVRNRIECLQRDQVHHQRIGNFALAKELFNAQVKIQEAFSESAPQLSQLFQKIFPQLKPSKLNANAFLDDYPIRLGSHLLLDKLPAFDLEYKGGMAIYSAHHIQGTLSEIAKSENLPPEFRSTTGYLINELKEFQEINFHFLNDSLDQLKADGEKFSDGLSQMKIGMSILLPYSLPGHSICVEVTRKGKDRFEFRVFNTGKGIEYHQKDVMMRWMTCLEFKEIPLSSIQDRNFWANFFSFSKFYDLNRKNYSTASNNNEFLKFYSDIYKLFKNSQLAKNQSPLEYEAPQEKGTCATQSIMSWIRHKVMREFPGTIEEKKAFYKAFKSLLYVTYCDINKEKLETIQSAIALPLKKHRDALVLLEYTQDPIKYSEALKIIIGEIERLQIEAWSRMDLEDLDSRDLSPMQRYANLRKICAFIASETDEKLSPSELLTLASYKIEKRKLKKMGKEAA